MKNYISILRGINVSGHKSIKMEDLRKSYERLGFTNITSYVQSGNVIFTAGDSRFQNLEQKISSHLEKIFHFEVPVIVLDLEKLQRIIDANPFLDDMTKDPSYMHVTFLSSFPDKQNIRIIEEKKQEGEELVVSDLAVYLYCPLGYGKSKLNNNLLEKHLKVTATTRNWKTTNALLKIAEQLT